jgi:galactokinase
MVVAHTGTPHASTHSGTLVIEAVKHTGRLAPLIEISEHARAFADAVRSSAFAEAAEAMNREASVRAAFLREFSTQEDEELARLGRDAGCGVRVAGRGSGGAVWAMGPEDGITFLRDAWRNVFAERGAGRVLATAPTMDGLRVSSAG